MTAEEYIKEQDWDSAIAACTLEIDRVTKENKGNKTKSGNNKDQKSTFPWTLVEAYMARGYAYCFASSIDKQYEKAVEDFSSAIALIDEGVSPVKGEAMPFRLECYAKRAYACWLKGDYEPAIADCERVKKAAGIQNGDVSKVPANYSGPAAFACELLGAIYANTGNPVEALRHYKDAIKLQAEAQKPCGFHLLENYRLACKKLKEY
jgi:tetratricopeptide (TPR) repeat protein